MERIRRINNEYGTKDKYVLAEEYRGVGIYREVAPSGCYIHQSWLIASDSRVVVIDSFNHVCKAELYDFIDNYNENKKFGIRAVVHMGTLHMHNNGRLTV